MSEEVKRTRRLARRLAGRAVSLQGPVRPERGKGQRSVVAQRDGWIDGRGPTRGNEGREGREGRDQKKSGYGHSPGPRIVGRHLVDEPLQEPHREPSEKGSRRNAQGGQGDGITDDFPQDAGAVRPDRHADPDLSPPLRDLEGHEGIEAGGGQNERSRREHREKGGEESILRQRLVHERLHLGDSVERFVGIERLGRGLPDSPRHVRGCRARRAQRHAHVAEGEAHLAHGNVELGPRVRAETPVARVAHDAHDLAFEGRLAVPELAAPLAPLAPLALLSGVRQEIAALDSDLPLGRVGTLSDRVDREMAQPGFNTLLVGVFAALALVLSVVGLYGLLSYTVAQRTRELGLRMALGAQRADLLTLILREGLLLTALGLCLGLVIAVAAGRLMSGLLFGVSPADPLTFAAVAAVLAATALAASYGPARRATRVDPTIALRYE